MEPKYRIDARNSLKVWCGLKGMRLPEQRAYAICQMDCEAKVKILRETFCLRAEPPL